MYRMPDVPFEAPFVYYQPEPNPTEPGIPAIVLQRNTAGSLDLFVYGVNVVTNASRHWKDPELSGNTNRAASLMKEGCWRTPAEEREAFEAREARITKQIQAEEDARRRSHEEKQARLAAEQAVRLEKQREAERLLAMRDAKNAQLEDKWEKTSAAQLTEDQQLQQLIDEEQRQAAGV
jgi:hypothetical protein